MTRWIPYAVGTGDERASFYRFYGTHTQILPTIGRHHPPDGGHAILDAIVLSAFLSCLIAALRARKSGN